MTPETLGFLYRCQNLSKDKIKSTSHLVKLVLIYLTFFTSVSSQSLFACAGKYFLDIFSRKSYQSHSCNHEVHIFSLTL